MESFIKDVTLNSKIMTSSFTLTLCNLHVPQSLSPFTPPSLMTSYMNENSRGLFHQPCPALEQFIDYLMLLGWTLYAMLYVILTTKISIKLLVQRLTQIRKNCTSNVSQMLVKLLPPISYDWVSQSSRWRRHKADEV